MKCAANRCNSSLGSSSKVVDLLSSVNTLIDNLTDSAVRREEEQPLPQSEVSVINSQLRQLERLFSKAAAAAPKKVGRRRSATMRRHGGGSRHRDASLRRRSQTVVVEGGCSRSPCSNSCNSAAATALSSSGGSETGHRPHHHHHQSAGRQSRLQRLLESSSRRGASRGGSGRKAGRRRAAAAASAAMVAGPEPPMNFGYLKRGLGDASGGGGGARQGRGCADAVANMERTAQSLQAHVTQLIRQCEQHQELQRQRGFQHCGLPERLLNEIRRTQARVAALRARLRHIEATGAGAAGGCRHVGTSSEQARDPLCDLRCKYERSLLYCGFDVNWPFLNIIAPRPPSFGLPPCCDEAYYG